MSESKKREIKVMRYGIILAVLLSASYFLFFEEPIVESRLTYTLSADEYARYSDLPNEVIQLENGEAYLSPNYESISDTLQAKGVRRFELKKFLKGRGENDVINEIYFKDQSKLEVPELIKELDFGKSKPVGKTVGIALLIIILSLLFDRFLNGSVQWIK